MAKRGRRAQVTIFIILGLVILLSAAIFIFLKNGIIQPNTNNLIPDEIKPIQQYTESCVSSITNDAAFLMMHQGGYITPERMIPEWSYDKPYLDTQSFKIPLWYYQSRPANIPLVHYPDFSYTLLENQMSAFIDERLPSCLNNFTQFKDKYDIKAIADANGKSGPKANVTINANDITVSVNYPLEITEKQASKVTRLSDFRVKVDSSLGRLFRLAYQIILQENNQQFLEILTDDMIASSGYLPYEGMNFDCSPKRWQFADVKSYIQTLISVNIRFLMFEGTKYDTTQYDYYNKNYKWNIGTTDFSDIRVNTLYQPSWGLNLDVKPRQGNTIKPIELDFAPAISNCLKIYHHKYSLEYDVMFQLIDTKNPENQFFFATPVYMKDNLPNRGNGVISWPPDVNQLDSTQYCSNTSTETVVVWDQLSGKLADYPNQPVDKQFYPLKVIVSDAYTRQPLYNASIKFQCVGFTCNDWGITDYPMINGLYTGEPPMLKKSFPECVNGAIIADKDGYFEGTAQHTTSQETSGDQVMVDLVKKLPKRFTLRVEQDSMGSKSVRPLLATESALVIVNSPDINFEQYLVFDSTGPAPNQDFFLALGDYNYNVDIKLIDNGHVVGGEKLDWRPTIDEIQGNSQVEFFAGRQLVNPPPSSDENYAGLWNYAVANSRRPELI